MTRARSERADQYLETANAFIKGLAAMGMDWNRQAQAVEAVHAYLRSPLFDTPLTSTSAVMMACYYWVDTKAKVLEVRVALQALVDDEDLFFSQRMAEQVLLDTLVWADGVRLVQEVIKKGEGHGKD